jgi:hypothetical protein
MSRTYRNIRYRQMWGSNIDYILKDSTDTKDGVPWDAVEWVRYDPSWYWCEHYEFRYKKTSKEGKKRIAKYFSDNGTYKCKEPGPHWYRNLYTERPNRRKTKRELQKFMLDNEYEPMIEAKPPLDYWT